jgi:hypothetical protein
MKKFSFLLIFSLLLFTACKKDHVDATNTKTLQSSINDMTSSLPTIKQIKFNEALYILKTFGIEAEGDINELNALGKLINGMKIPEILSLADQVAQKNGIEWSSTGPPSLGEMNIFGNDQAKESDPNDIPANTLSIDVNPVGADNVSLQIVPRLIDSSGKFVNFSGAALETVLEVYSGGNKILTSKNLMQDNNFKGFTLRFISLHADKIVDNKIDITVSVKTTNKTFKMTKVGIDVNPKALLMPTENPSENPENTEETIPTDFGNTNSSQDVPVSAVTADPKNSVNKFLNSLNNQNLRAAYDISENPNWGSYENFSNPTSGFGGVKNISVKNISTNSSSGNSASVNATYEVTDKNGKITTLKVTFGLKNVNGEWKVSSYKIN